MSKRPRRTLDDDRKKSKPDVYAELPYIWCNGVRREQMQAMQKKKPKTRLDFRLDSEAIESDEEPNDALKRAAERYKQRFGGREPSR